MSAVTPAPADGSKPAMVKTTGGVFALEIIALGELASTVFTFAIYENHKGLESAELIYFPKFSAKSLKHMPVLRFYLQAYERKALVIISRVVSNRLFIV
jgi:hypothetical protein